MLGEGMAGEPRIVAVDSQLPPRSLSVQLAEAAYAAVIVVAPGHSATLVYPTDSATANRLDAGVTRIDIQIPANLVRSDSATLARRRQQRAEEEQILRARARVRSTRGTALGPLPISTPTYLLLLTSDRPLVFDRMLDKTAGVSIPAEDLEALHAVAKAIRSTIAAEPRRLAGYYQLVELNPIR